jgi:serine/threonine-protein kinase
MFEDGDTLGPYTIVRRLGAGAMGEVYQARHRHMGRDAAIKVLRSELTEEADVVARFFTEARATAAVRHPGIVEIFDCDLHRSGRAFIVMEYLPGEDLAHRLSSRGSFAGDWPALRGIGRQLAGALAAAHGAGIVHRDLKPGNIFLVEKQGAEPVAKIVDFGIAKLLRRDGGEHSQTQTGHILGTPLYMSPEQAKGAKTIDHRTDIYALGCVLFELATGQPPFVRKGPAQVIVAHLHETAPRASSLEPSVPPELDALIAEMLAKDPDKRPRAMTDVAARLAEPPAAAPGRIATQLLPGGRASGGSGPIVAPAVKPAPTPAAPVGPAPAPAGIQAPRAAAAPAAMQAPRAAPAPAPQPQVVVRPGSAASAPTRAGYAGREALPAREAQLLERAGSTTLGNSASEMVAETEVVARAAKRSPWILIGAAAVVVVGGVGFALSRSGGHAAVPVIASAPPVAAPQPPPAAPPAAPAVSRIPINSQPAGAAVWIGDEPAARGRTPLTIELAAGSSARATLRYAGREPVSIMLDANDTGPRVVELPGVVEHPPRPSAPAPAPAKAPHKHHGKGGGEFKAIED